MAKHSSHEIEEDNLLVKDFVENGNFDAFGRIYEKYVREVYRIVFMRIGRRDAAEDVVSETFETLMRILVNFRFDSSLKTFIIGVAINKTRQFWQKQSNAELSLDEEFMQEEIVEEDLNTDKAKKLATEILNKLDEPYKSVLQKRFIENKSIKVTADELGLSEANVRVVQFRAIKKAAKFMNHE